MNLHGLLAEPLIIKPFLGSMLHVLQHSVLHKTQVNSLRTKETLLDPPLKAVEKAGMVNNAQGQMTC